MKHFRLLFYAMFALAVLSCCSTPKVETSVPHSVVNGKIVLETPRRAPGQQSALLLTCEPMETVRVGFVGLGMRGYSALNRFSFIEGVKMTALCDIETERVNKAQEKLHSLGLDDAETYDGEDGWKRLCESDNVDLVYLCTPWQNHVEMAVYAMEHGKHVAVEVPAAMNIAQCWQLVDTCEKTRKHCMMLENCCYDFFEMTILNMAQHGLFGDVIYAEGAYIHNLDPYWHSYHGNWRLSFNQEHRGDVYPTHGLGPICQVMNIHRGDKFNYLVSMDTDSYHGADVAEEMMGTRDFANGDHTVTLIRTAKGKMIQIQHNVYTRRPYDRKYQIEGVEGYACKYPTGKIAIMEKNISDDNPSYDDLDGEQFVDDATYKALMEKFKSPIASEIEDLARKVGGHGGMDFIMDYRLIYCLRHGLPLDQDVYDAAEWSCMTELSGLSILYGSMPVEVPDFTRGEWEKVDGFHYYR